MHEFFPRWAVEGIATNRLSLVPFWLGENQGIGIHIRVVESAE